ncbi:hypothetical protein [Selenomonas noxia]|uniref:hypothetical protein n=1 Tax=Selenomonas noxia TaxID=135083 RepID=UPI003C718DEF
MVDLKEVPKMLRDAADALETMQSGQTNEKAVSLEDVRSVLVRKSAEGKREAVKALITKYGVDRLSDIPADAYAGILKEVEDL